MKNTSLFLMAIFLLASACSETKTETTYEAPEWAKKVVWYQIFPERFRNGNKANDPVKEYYDVPDSWEISSWTADWYARADWEKEVGGDFYRTVFERRYGGDLQGVIDKLDYLKELGIGVIYFNPIFDAKSLHKYDAAYFHHVDRFFGKYPPGDVMIMEGENPVDPSTWKWTSADLKFLELIEEAHHRDIRIVIDGVWNHTGPEFWAFQDIIDNQENSEFKDWYEITSFDDPSTPENEFDYNGWWGFKGLPVLSEENDGLIDPIRDHIFDVTSRWMDPNGDGDPSDGIDGWRLDVASEVGKRFWKEWHAHVKDINPEAITVAEIWTEDATEYINAEMFNSVMNYRVTYPVVDYFFDNEITAGEFVQQLRAVYESYPEEANFVFQNLLDSHDTPRVASQVFNPTTQYDHEVKPRDGYDVRKPTEEERRIQKLAAVFQYTYVGAPMIYYGTESGMWGADDPDDRKPMLWDDLVYDDEVSHPYGDKRPTDLNVFDQGLFDFYARLAKIRNESESLQKGKLEIIMGMTDKNVVSYSRVSEFDKTFVVLNNSDETQEMEFTEAQAFEFGDDLVNMIDGTVYEVSGGILKLSIPAKTGLILK